MARGIDVVPMRREPIKLVRPGTNMPRHRPSAIAIKIQTVRYLLRTGSLSDTPAFLLDRTELFGRLMDIPLLFQIILK